MMNDEFLASILRGPQNTDFFDASPKFSSKRFIIYRSSFIIFFTNPKKNATDGVQIDGGICQ